MESICIELVFFWFTDELPCKRRKTSTDDAETPKKVKENCVEGKRQETNDKAKESSMDSSGDEKTDSKANDKEKADPKKDTDEAKKKDTDSQKSENSEESNQSKNLSTEDVLKTVKNSTPCEKEEEECEEDAPQPSTSTAKQMTRERKKTLKPTIVNLLYKSIESVFTMINKK